MLAPWQKPVRGLQINKTHPLARGLVACYVMNEATGNIVGDLSGNGNHGTLVGKPDWCADGLDFVAANSDYVDLDAVGIGGNITTNFVFSTWFEGSTTGDMALVFGSWRSDNGPNVLVYLDASSDNLYSLGSLKFLIDDTGFYHTRLDGGVNSNTGITDGELHNLVVAVDCSTNIIDFYVDNIKQTTVYKYQNADISHQNFPQHPFLGGVNSNGALALPINGVLFNTCIYNRALPPQQIAWLNREPFCFFEQPTNPALMYYETLPGVPIPVFMDGYRRRRVM